MARNGSPHARDPSSATTVFFGSSHVDRLNDHVKRATGATAGHLIRQQLITEAKRYIGPTLTGKGRTGSSDALLAPGNHRRIKTDMIYPFTPDSMAGVHQVLRGLHRNMKVEIELGIPLAAKTVWDLRARSTWPPSLRLVLCHDPQHFPESIVRVERV